MINDTENEIENLSLQECSFKDRSFWKFYFAWNVYEMETVTSGFCYIEDLIFLENNIIWFWNSLDVQSTDSSVELYNILPYSKVLLLTTFCTSFWKGVHNSNKIVYLFVKLFVLTISYVDIKAYIKRIFYLQVVYIIYQYIFILGVFIFSIMEV